VEQKIERIAGIASYKNSKSKIPKSKKQIPNINLDAEINSA